MARKRTGRAYRRDKITGDLRAISDELRSLIENFEFPDESEEKKFAKATKEFTKQANDIVARVDYGDLESLKEEIGDWRSNIEEKFSQTDKYSRLEECEQTLESACDQLSSCQDEFDDATTDEVEARADEIEQACDEADNAEFPGMYG